MLGRSKDVEVDNVPSGSAITLPMFCDVAPFDNVDVRLALKHAIDREEIVQKILFGTGTPGNDFHVSPNMPYWPDIEQRVYDPDKAKFHLKKAGMESLSVSLSAADSVLPGAVDMIVLYSEQAKAAGIDIKPVREANDSYWADVWLKKPFSSSRGGPPRRTHVHVAYSADPLERGATGSMIVQRIGSPGKQNWLKRGVPRCTAKCVSSPATMAELSFRCL